MFKFESKSYGKGNKEVVFLFTGWGNTIKHFHIVSKILELNGFYCITYAYDREIFSPNILKTIRNFTKVEKDVLKKINLLKRNGYEKFYLFGTSLGSLLAFIIANNSKDISKIIVNLTGADVAEIVWGWEEYGKDFKNEILKYGITLNKLKKEWNILSPINNIDNLYDKKILVYIARKDKIIPYKQGLKLVKKLKDLKYNFKLRVNEHFDHTLGGIFNLLNFRLYLDFLKDD